MRLAVSVVLLLLVLPVFAQDDAVVITATRFPDAKRDLPVGVTLIDADDLRRSASTNLAEVLAQFGLVHIRDSTGTPNQQLDLRGFGITGDQNTLVLLDGVRLSENELASAQVSAIPLEAIERIEIVRGSGAVLYGGGASGGAINIITRRPEPGTTRAMAAVRTGGYGTGEARAGFGRAGERLGISLDASHEDTEGYRRHNRFRQSNAAARLDARGDTGQAYLRLAFGRQHLELPGALSEAEIAADRRQAGAFLGEADRDDSVVTLGGEWWQGRHSYAAHLAYRDKRAPARFGAFEIDTRVDLWSLAPRAKLRFDALGREHDLTLGADLERWTYDSASPFGERTGTQENHALYALANLWIAERTRFVLGARAQRTEARLDAAQATHDLSAYEAALRQRLAAGWSVYGKLASSFRVATFDEICLACPDPLLAPQTARGGEAGIELERRGLRLRAAYFDQRLSNEIYFSPLVGFFGENVNLPPTRRRGLELEAAWRALQGLELNLAVALLEARFRAGVLDGVAIAGNRVPLVPEAIASAGAAWTLAPRSRLNVHARYVGRQRFDNDQANVFRHQPDYTLVDLKLEHGFTRRLSGALEVRNLFAERYFSYGVWDFGTSFFAYPQPGRTAYLSLAYRLE